MANVSKGNILGILALIGAILMIVGVFVTWVSFEASTLLGSTAYDYTGWQVYSDDMFSDAEYNYAPLVTLVAGIVAFFTAVLPIVLKKPAVNRMLGVVSLILGIVALGGDTGGSGLLGGQTGAALGEGLLMFGLGTLGGLLVLVLVIIVLVALERRLGGLGHGIDDLGLHDRGHLLLGFLELTNGTADRSAHLRELIRAKEQEAKDQDDCQLTFSNSKHTYLQGSM